MAVEQSNTPDFSAQPATFNSLSLLDLQDEDSEERQALERIRAARVRWAEQCGFDQELYRSALEELQPRTISEQFTIFFVQAAARFMRWLDTPNGICKIRLVVTCASLFIVYRLAQAIVTHWSLLKVLR
jgi:hypothetical protein